MNSFCPLVTCKLTTRYLSTAQSPAFLWRQWPSVHSCFWMHSISSMLHSFPKRYSYFFTCIISTKEYSRHIRFHVVYISLHIYHQGASGKCWVTWLLKVGHTALSDNKATCVACCCCRVNVFIKIGLTEPSNNFFVVIYNCHNNNMTLESKTWCGTLKKLLWGPDTVSDRLEMRRRTDWWVFRCHGISGSWLMLINVTKRESAENRWRNYRRVPTMWQIAWKCRDKQIGMWFVSVAFLDPEIC